MKVLLTGAGGQLGQALRGSVPAGVTLIATSRSGGQGLLPLDLADATACRTAVLQHQPDWVINAGAFTAVDLAESEPDLAHAVNAGAPRAFAEALLQHGGRLLQLSTDFVFNGRQGHPYRPDQPRDPLGVYGASKAAGEAALDELLLPSRQGIVLRTSWVMGPVGRNFALTMLWLHRERHAAGTPLAVVEDQVGCPTCTHTLAAACWRTIACNGGGAPVLHWSDAGAASWYDVALAVGELGVELGLLPGAAAVMPITTADYPTPAQRPSFSRLDCSQTRQLLDLPPTPWRLALRQLLLASSTG
ncbi:MAG: dTDP-4-dehydrorhamnose reductase [Cyanobacteria bacterium K_DeepCast_35m_m2_023]|nr:dTDP-4-dehydrorhamnose reductase [Cyanobacteria bacterium K_DeepCast_35m_m2_023]